MSDSSSDSGNSGSGRQRRSGGRRRSGGNRNRNRSGGGGGSGDGGGGGGEGGQQGRRSGGRRSGGRRSGGRRDGGRRDGGRRSGGRRDGGNRSGGPRSTPKAKPLTFWQKILKAIGLYNPNKRTSPSRVPKPPEKKIKTKSGTRKVRTESVPVETERLYVGNLSYDADEQDLEELFKGVGTVRDVDIVYNQSTHRSKGFAFVTMSMVAEAQRAVDTLHDESFMNRNLIVSGSKSEGPAQPREEDDAPAKNEQPAVPAKEENFDLADAPAAEAPAAAEVAETAVEEVADEAVASNEPDAEAPKPADNSESAA